MNQAILKIGYGLFIVSVVALLWFCNKGYGNAIGWEVRSTAEAIQFPALTIDTGLASHVIEGEKYLITEAYQGSEIKRNLKLEMVLLAGLWIGFIATITGISYLHRYAFFIGVALITLFLNRLNLFMVGLFGIEERLIVMLPFLLFVGPLIYFNEFKKDTPLWLRIVVLLVSTIILLLGVNDAGAFHDHMLTHAHYGWVIVGILFLFLVSEELVFGALYIITIGKGGKNNHLHFIIISLIYIGNLTLYYLNRTGLAPNNFHFFDPYLLLAISCLVAIFTFRFKISFFEKYVPKPGLSLLFVGTGMIALLVIGLAFQQGSDAVFEGFHYMIMYFHLGFGFIFFLYVLINFIDPLIKGIEVYKVAYRENTFPYFSAKLGGMAIVLGLFLQANRESFLLFQAGYFNHLANSEIRLKNDLLTQEYLLQSSYHGLNTHFPNYHLASIFNNRGNEKQAKFHFEKASSRYPSAFSLVNFGNLEQKMNPNKVQVMMEELLLTSDDGQLQNNLGLIAIEKAQFERALALFDAAKPDNNWNQSPLINERAVLYKYLNDTAGYSSAYRTGNYGVKANVLLDHRLSALAFEHTERTEGHPMHRQAYLLNACFAFEHDSIATAIEKTLDVSTNKSTNDRLRLGLAIYHYKKGEVNRAFRWLDYLQANANPVDKRNYLNILSILSLDQGAPKLSKDYAENAMLLESKKAVLLKAEALFFLGQEQEIADFFLAVLQSHPDLTAEANQLLTAMDTHKPVERNGKELIPGMPKDDLIAMAKRNAFDEQTVLACIAELKKRSVSESYNILVEAIEINPYSSALLRAYILEAIEWNLTSYAQSALEKLRNLEEPAIYKAFLSKVQSKIHAADEAGW